MCLPPHRGLLNPGPSQQVPSRSWVTDSSLAKQAGGLSGVRPLAPLIRPPQAHSSDAVQQHGGLCVSRETSRRAPVSDDPGTAAAGEGDVEVSVNLKAAPR